MPLPPNVRRKPHWKHRLEKAQKGQEDHEDSLPPLVPLEADIELDDDTAKYYSDQYQKREALADDIRAEEGETEFKLSDSLRVTWVSLQRVDPQFIKVIQSLAKAKDDESEHVWSNAQGWRIASDGLLEKLVVQPAPLQSAWLPVVPEGQATANLTWKRWLFLQCHVGLLGAHRNGEKTLCVMLRQVWWPTIKEDVDKWWNKCLTCLRFRKMPQKQETVAQIRADAECWEEVMIDLEGPSHPVDKDGNI